MACVKCKELKEDGFSPFPTIQWHLSTTLMPQSSDLVIFVMTKLIYIIDRIQTVITLLSLHVRSLGDPRGHIMHDNIMVLKLLTVKFHTIL